MTDDLVAFLKAQLDADERVAQAVEDSESSWTAAVDVGDEYNYAVVTSEAPAALQVADGELLVGGGSNLVARCGEMYFDGENYRNHIARWDPARVLAEVQAKRRIIDLHEGDHECSTYDHNGEIDNCTWVIGDCSTLRLLASVYAGRPGWRSEWAPDEEENHG